MLLETQNCMLWYAAFDNDIVRQTFVEDKLTTDYWFQVFEEHFPFLPGMGVSVEKTLF